MTDRSDEFRKAAADCLQLARATSDASTRVALLAMAQRWFDLSEGSRSQADFDAALRVLNEGQMRSQPVTQQQQQIQPNESDHGQAQTASEPDPPKGPARLP
jgi:hypothetical protein